MYFYRFDSIRKEVYYFNFDCGIIYHGHFLC